MKIGKEIKNYNTLELKPNPTNITIYGEEEPDPSLIDSIKEQGQLEPIVITENKVIISGHRRWLALKALKMPTAICLTITFKDELEEKEAIIEFNKQRKKTVSQIGNEARLLETIYTERAERRRLANLKNSPEVPNSAHQEETGKTRDLVASKLGIGHDKLSKIQMLSERAKSGDEVAIRELKKTDLGQTTVDAATKVIEISDIANSDSPLAEKAKVVLDQIERGEITSNKAKKQLKEEKDIIEAQVAKGTKIPKGIFNVILCDPPHPFEDILNKKIPANEDSVLFLWSDANSLVKSLDLMQYWGFEYKSMVVLDKGTTGSGSLVLASSYDVLLISFRGSGLLPVSKLPGIIHEKKHDCIYELIEKMFPGQKCLELFKDNKRNGWNIGHIEEPKQEPDPEPETQIDATRTADIIEEELAKPVTILQQPQQEELILVKKSVKSSVQESELGNESDPEHHQSQHEEPKPVKQSVNEQVKESESKKAVKNKLTKEKLANKPVKENRAKRKQKQELVKPEEAKEVPKQQEDPKPKEPEELDELAQLILLILRKYGDLQLKPLIKHICDRNHEKVPEEEKAYHTLETRIWRKCGELKDNNLIVFRKEGQKKFFSVNLSLVNKVDNGVKVSGG